MPASSSLSIAAVAEQVGQVPDLAGRATLSGPVELASQLGEALTEVVDPRARRGVRHGLVVVSAAYAGKGT